MMSYSKRSRYSRSPSYRHYSRSVSSSVSRSRSRSRDSSDVENPGNNLYVTGLSPRVTKRDLEKHFSTEGKVEDVHLVVDPWTRESRGFGFVSMSTLEEADRCIKYLNRSVLEGRVIMVEKARRRRGRTPTPGRYLGLRTMRVRRRSPSSPPQYRSRSHYSSERDRSRSYSPYYSRRRSYSPYYSRGRSSSRSRSPYSKHDRSYSPYDSRYYSPDDRYYRRSRYRSPYDSRYYSPDDRYYRRSSYRSVSRSISPRVRSSRRSYSRSLSPRSRRSYRRSYSPSVSPRHSRRSYSHSISPKPRRSSRSYFHSNSPRHRRSSRSISGGSSHRCGEYRDSYSSRSYSGSHSRSATPRSASPSTGRI